jgi:oligoendopeptidase F
MLNKESRIFMTFNESLGDVLTLAHDRATPTTAR